MNRTTRAGLVFLLILSSFFVIGPSSAQAEEPDSRPASWEPRVSVARYLSPVGSLLVSVQPGRPWRTLGQRAELYSRDLLLALPGMSGRLETSPRAVELTLWGNLPELADYYGLQSGVILHDSRAFDLDFTLHCGRVLVHNRKEKGPARIWLRVEGAGFQLTLAEPGDALCLALSSFWPRDAHFTLSPKPEEGPVRTLNFLAIKGQVDVKTGGTQHSLSAPPGPASFHWDSINGPETVARHRRQLEAWADPTRKAPPSAKAFRDVIDRYEATVQDRDPRTALFDLLAAAAKAPERAQSWATAEFAVFSLAAIDDLERVMQALEDSRQPEVRKAAASALRHWIGDAAGRDRRLYDFLIERLRYTKAQAATVLQLLHTGFAPEEPETYETLIAYLLHTKLAIRELAWRQLLRLVPEDILVQYDPAAPDKARTKAYNAWKQLIPSGSLPSRKAKQK